MNLDWENGGIVGTSVPDTILGIERGTKDLDAGRWGRDVSQDTGTTGWSQSESVNGLPKSHGTRPLRHRKWDERGHG
jgi:hypothetical protein